jgi:hypothetical protein
MSELDHNLPDDFWRKAFEEASEAPPSRVWDAVERRLDEDNKTKILPLWGMRLASSRPFAWGIGVAAVIALLLVGRWAFWTTAPNKSLAQHQPKTHEQGVASSALNKSGKNATQKEPHTSPSTLNERGQGDVAMNQQLSPPPGGSKRSAPVAPSQTASTEDQLTGQSVAKSPVQPSIALPAEEEKAPHEGQIVATQPVSTAQQTLVPSGFRTDMTQNKQVAFAGRPLSAGIAAATSMNRMATESDATLKIPAASEPLLSFDPVHTSSLRLREPGSIQRIVWLPPAESVTETAAVQPKHKLREMWASMSMMPGAFNPSVTVRSAQASFSNANTNLSTNPNSVGQPSVNSRANFSVAYQAGAGIQLNERWSVESGVGYLAGRSTVESPVQASVLSSLSVSPNTLRQNTNLYVDALRSSVRSASSASQDAVASPAIAVMGYTNRNTVQNTYSLQTRQSLTNDYQFVQVPVQVGYQLRPRKRLGLALVGGFLSNIFVRNTVGNELIITNKDGVYRPVSWAATLGARVRYRPSRQWSASLAGVYQPSLGFGTRPQSAVQSQHTSTGMSFGINYHF